MTPEECRLLDFANLTPDVLSLLYDLDLMPEQVTGKPRLWSLMLAVIDHASALVAAEREACARVADGFQEQAGGIDTGQIWRTACALNIAWAIRARGASAASGGGAP